MPRQRQIDNGDESRGDERGTERKDEKRVIDVLYSGQKKRAASRTRDEKHVHKE